MLNQFEINNYAKKRISEFLAEKQCDLKTAMDDEQLNPQIAAILHDGLPTMVKRIYSLNKMQTFFWEKRELLFTYIEGRLMETVQKSKK